MVWKEGETICLNPDLNTAGHSSSVLWEDRQVVLLNPPLGKVRACRHAVYDGL